MKKNRWLSFVFTACAMLGAGCSRQAGFSGPVDAGVAAADAQTPARATQVEEEINELIAETACTGQALKEGLRDLGLEIFRIDGGGMNEDNFPYVDLLAVGGGVGVLVHAVCDPKSDPPIKVDLYDAGTYVRI